MKVKYVGVFDSVTVPLPYGGEVVCERDGVVDVPDSLGASLLEQSIWEPANPAKKRDEKPAAPADGGDD